MKLNLLEMLRRVIRGKMEDKGASPDEADRLAKEAADQMGSGMSNANFEDVAGSLRDEYPDITDEELERAITIHDDGYTIHEHELPEKPFAEQLERLKRTGMWGVWILSQRTEQVCDICRRADDGSHYAIEEAIDEQPLPHKGCTCPDEICRDNGTCGCSYMPVLTP